MLRERCGIGVLSTIPNRYPPEGYLLFCGGEDAISFWQKLRDLVDQSGYWPVILGNDKEVTRVLEVADSEYGQPLRQILDEAASQSAEQWLKGRDHSHHSSMQRAYGNRAPEQLASLHGDWPDDPKAMTAFTIPSNA